MSKKNSAKDVIYNEVFNADKLAHIIKNQDIYVKQMRDDCSQDYNPFLLPERYLRNSVNSKTQVKYRQIGCDGRLFACGGLSLQSFAREIRHTIANEHYIDIDIANCHPVIMSHLCQKEKIETKYLDKYIKKREKIITELLDKNEKHGKEYIKKMILSCLNGGSQAYDNLPYKTPWLISFKKEITEAHEKLCKSRDNDFKEHKKKTTSKHSIQASFINKILCNVENEILQHMIDYFKIKTNDIAVLCFDGIMLPKNRQYSLVECEDYVYNKTNIKINLKIKKMDEGFELPKKIEKYDPDTFNWSKSANKIFEILLKDTFNESFSDETVSNAFVELVRGDMIVINDMGDGYHYNEKNKLWELKSAKLLMRNITMLDEYFVSLLNLIEKYMTDADDDNMKKYYSTMFKSTQAQRKRVKSTRGIKDVFYMASSDLFDETFQEGLNINHSLLPIKPNKTIDLSTGMQRDRMRDDMFSFECPVEYIDNTNLDNVNKYMRTTFCENDELIEYMQERMGVFLTGETLREIDVWYGSGLNGKTTTSELLRQIMGKFYTTINKSVFIEDPKSHQAKGAAHTSHLIPMIGKRLGMSSEVKEGDEFNTTMLKGLSGGDPITYREAYSKDEKTFVSFMKSVLMTNPKPQFNFEDKALIDRLRYVHFNAKFVEKPNPEKKNEYEANKEFIHTMQTTEINNFFSYLVQGAIRFYTRGKKLVTPDIVMAAKMEGLKEADRVGRFISDCCVVSAEGKISLSFLMGKFENYLRDNGENPAKRGELSKGLIAMNFKQYKSHGVMTFKGVSIEGVDNDDD